MVRCLLTKLHASAIQIFSVNKNSGVQGPEPKIHGPKFWAQVYHAQPTVHGPKVQGGLSMHSPRPILQSAMHSHMHPSNATAGSKFIALISFISSIWSFVSSLMRFPIRIFFVSVSPSFSMGARSLDLQIIMAKIKKQAT